MLNKFEKTFFVKVNITVENIVGKTCATESRNGQNCVIDITLITEKGQISTGNLSAVRNSENVYPVFACVFFDGLNKGIQLVCTGNSAHSEVTVKVKNVLFSDVVGIFTHNFRLMLESSVGIKHIKVRTTAFFGRYAVSFQVGLTCSVGITRHIAEHIHNFFADGRGDFLGIALRESTKSETEINDSLQDSFADIVHINSPDMDFFAVFALFVHPGGRVAGNNNDRVFGVFFPLSR